MKIIVLAATNLEISLLISIPECRFVEKMLGFNVYNINRNGDDIYIIEGGPGLANVSAAAALAIERFKPEHLFNVGVCGVYSNDISLLTKAVAGKSAVFAAAGVETENLFQDMADIGLPFYAKGNGEDIYNTIHLCDDPAAESVLRGVFLSLSAVSGNAVQAEKMKKRFDLKDNIVCEDMETAAAALIAYRAGIPCTVIRGISNLCGDRNYQNWRLKEAAEVAQQELIKAIESKDCER